MGGPETQAKAVEALSRAYFEREEDITDHAVLKQAGLAAGLDVKGLDELLNSNRQGAKVDRQVELARRQGVHGVPSISLQGLEVGGTKQAEDWQVLFERIKAMEKS